MTTQEVANRFNELAQEGRFDLIQDELFSQDALSIEPVGAQMPNAESLIAIKKKGQDFNDMVEEMYGGSCSEPVVGGAYFSVAMSMECKLKGHPDRVKMDEIAVYEVRNGKITMEQFFYPVQ